MKIALLCGSLPKLNPGSPTSGELHLRERLVEIGSQRGPILSRERYYYPLFYFLAEKNGLKAESLILQNPHSFLL